MKRTKTGRFRGDIPIQRWPVYTGIDLGKAEPGVTLIACDLWKTIELALLLECPQVMAREFEKQLKEDRLHPLATLYFMKQANKHLKTTPEEARALLERLRNE